MRLGSALMFTDLFCSGRQSSQALRLIAVMLATLFWPGSAVSQTTNWELPSIDWSPRLHSPLGACNGHCGIAIYRGKYAVTGMPAMVGKSGFVAPWNYDYLDSSLTAVTFSRRVASFGNVAQFEVEAGVAKRFGILREAELWGAIYARWTWFPWNDIIKTSIATSTGVSYATGHDEVERIRSNNGGRGSLLMHYFSPEVTFALPSLPDLELLLRIHHRSGGVDYGMGPMFRHSAGGAHYTAVGLRYRF